MVSQYVFQDIVRVYDTDAQGIAHYAAYYRFFTNTIEKFFQERVGVPYPIVDENLWFVIVESEAKYLKPVRLGERLTVLMEPEKVSEKVLKFKLKILRDGDTTTEGYLVQVAINPKVWKSVEIPKTITDRVTL
ncbi:acyl-CoA thioesterase [Metallosphaera tengchongensis]|uniref:Acyl-CoA thioesterase n=1 Tax=Metallosphaera tengchongensis TaxID=1532350 RepID=A0A6N0NYL2_9CREN|nr:thioesterase family protein [Metallosphaera tengchongensis]QKR00659.1 acyl-CoA thioesterase [Metallosphaera tengchongensis]